MMISAGRHDGAQLLHRLESHFGIANVRDKASDISQPAMLTFERTRLHLAGHETQRRSCFFQMLSRFVDGRGLAVTPCFTGCDRTFDLLTTNPPHAFAERLFFPQSEGHAYCSARTMLL